MKEKSESDKIPPLQSPFKELLVDQNPPQKIKESMILATNENENLLKIWSINFLSPPPWIIFPNRPPTFSRMNLDIGVDYSGHKRYGSLVTFSDKNELINLH